MFSFCFPFSKDKMLSSDTFWQEKPKTDDEKEEVCQFTNLMNLTLLCNKTVKIISNQKGILQKKKKNRFPYTLWED